MAHSINGKACRQMSAGDNARYAPSNKPWRVVMAAVSLGQQYLQMGPRQGVYICSRSIRWSPAQFRSPAESYRFRERINPTTPATSTGATQNSVVKRPFSASSTRTSTPRPPLSTPVPRSTTSYCNGASRKPCTRVATANRKMQDTHSRSESSEFSLTAKALIIQPRPSQRSHMSSVTNSHHVTPEQPFSYPDPYKIQGDPAFSVRIAELTRLECDTLKYEDWKKRTSVSKWSANHPPGSLSRSMSARGYRSTTLRAVSENVSTSVEGGRKSLPSRKSSLPATFNSTTTTVQTPHPQSPSVKSCSIGSSAISPSPPPAPTDNSGLLPPKSTRDASSQTCCLTSETSEDSELEEEGWQSEDVSCEDTDSCKELQNEDNLSVLEESVNLLHLNQEKEAMNCILEQQSDTCPPRVEGRNSDKTNHTEQSTNINTTDVACRKKLKRRRGSCKKKNSKMKSHSTPGLDHTPSVHSSSSTCSLKSTKTHVHRKKSSRLVSFGINV